MKPMKMGGIILVMSLVSGILDPLWAVDEQQQAYDQMVEEATREADEYVEEKLKEQQDAAEVIEQQKDAVVDERIQAERERLEAEMDKVRDRGLGPNFTGGVRDNLLQKLENKLNQLESDPLSYFGE